MEIKMVVGNEDGVCPVCGSHDLEWGDNELFAECIEYGYTCNDCGNSGYERYNLVFDSITAEVAE